MNDCPFPCCGVLCFIVKNSLCEYNSGALECSRDQLRPDEYHGIWICQPCVMTWYASVKLSPTSLLARLYSRCFVYLHIAPSLKCSPQFDPKSSDHRPVILAHVGHAAHLGRATQCSADLPQHYRQSTMLSAHQAA